jgi:hypothetical protein
MPRHRPGSLVALLAVVGLAIVVAGCSASPPASFDPAGPCTADAGDGSAPGAFPDLEARIPTTFEEQAAQTLDSGRHCTAANLGALAELGFEEVRFAGGTWSFGGRRSLALAVFSAPGLRAEDIAVFYTNSAAASNRTVVTATSSPELAGRPGFRIDTETGERLQTVLVWPADGDDPVHVVITTDLPDPILLLAVDALEAASAP